MNLVVLVECDTRGPSDPPHRIYDICSPEGFGVDTMTFAHFWEETKAKYAIPGSTVTLLEPIRKCVPSSHTDVDPQKG